MIDIFNPEVSVVTKGLRGKSIVIYGGNRTGKTLNCAKANKSIFLRFENGLNAINGARSFAMTKWSDWTNFVKQLTNPMNEKKVKEMYETIVIDTMDRMLALGEEYICNLYNIQSVDRDDNNKKAYGGHYKEYRAEVIKWVNLLTNSGFTVIFIGHEGTTTLQDDKGNDYTKIIPAGDKKSVGVICDLSEIYYAHAEPMGENGKEVKSTLYLKGTKYFLAGSRFKHVPESIAEWNIEKLEKTLGEAVEAEENETGISAITYEEAEIKAKNENVAKVPIGDLINSIGEIVQNMSNQNGNIEPYYQIMEEEFGTRDFKAMEATERQREQVEQLLNALKAKGY